MSTSDLFHEFALPPPGVILRVSNGLSEEMAMSLPCAQAQQAACSPSELRNGLDRGERNAPDPFRDRHLHLWYIPTVDGNVPHPVCKNQPPEANGPKSDKITLLFPLQGFSSPVGRRDRRPLSSRTPHLPHVAERP